MEFNIRTSERIYDWDAREWPFVDGQMIFPGEQDEDGLPDIPMTWFEWFRMSDGSFRR